MSDSIVQVVTQMEAGGAQRVAMLLHQELRSRGLPAELWFLFARTQAYAADPGVSCLWPRRPQPHELPGLLAALATRTRRLRPHAMIAHTHYANVMALPVAKFCGVPVRLAVHHNAITTYPRAARWMERICKRTNVYTASIAVSLDVLSSLIQYDAPSYLDTSQCIYNGLASIEALESGRITCDIANRFQGKKVLFNAGRLTEQKNQQALVRVLARLPECAAVIAGRGPLEGALRQQATDLGVMSRLHFLGEVSSDAVAHWMRQSDVFVFPSKFEAMPMALLEAMRAGMAIVASDIPAHREVAGDSILLSDTAPVSLSLAIRRALQQRGEGNPLGAAARQRSLRFTVGAMADAYLEAI
jgi:glycosyltransferase involved in cell wall biosynthesis